MNLFKLSVVALAGALTINGFGQEANLDRTNFLKNYKAPNYSVRALTASANLSSYQHNISSSSVSISNFQVYGFSRYDYFLNRSNFQSTNAALLATGFLNRSNLSSVNTLNVYLQTYGVTRNYFYPFSNNVFFSVQGKFSNQLRFFEQDGTSARSNGLRINPGIAAGFGRLEPIEYAKNVLDLEKMLSKSGVLDRYYTPEELREIADLMAVTNKTRLHNFGLRRINQYEALDAGLKGIGNLSSNDARYFAAVSEAYMYSNVFPRFSGFRHEFGFTGDVERSRTVETGFDYVTSEQSVGAYYSFDWRIPQSQLIQHEIKAIALLATRSNEAFGETFNSNPAYGLVSYNLRVFPNVRMNANIGALAVYGGDLSGNLHAGITTNGTFFLTPRIQTFYSASYLFGETSTNGLQELSYFYGIGNGVPATFGQSINVNAGFRFAIF